MSSNSTHNTCGSSFDKLPPPVAATTAARVCDDEYFLVRRPSVAISTSANKGAGDSPDEKKVVTTQAKLSPVLVDPSHLRLMKGRLSRKSASKDGLIRVRLWQKINQSQSTTALLTASALQPGSANGYSELGALYDDARCLGVTVHCAALSSDAAFNTWAVAFDPSQSGNLSSVLLGLEHKYKLGPMVVSTQNSAANGVASPSGFHTMRCTTVKAFQSGVSSDIIGSNWYPASSTSGIVGYLKPYVENGGAATVYLVTYVEYDMEFKYRG